jgi:hypothetical protein
MKQLLTGLYQLLAFHIDFRQRFLSYLQTSRETGETLWHHLITSFNALPTGLPITSWPISQWQRHMLSYLPYKPGKQHFLFIQVLVFKV